MMVSIIQPGMFIIHLIDEIKELTTVSANSAACGFVDLESADYIALLTIDPVTNKVTISDYSTVLPNLILATHLNGVVLLNIIIDTTLLLKLFICGWVIWSLPVGAVSEEILVRE
jgi:hypothetical protein